MKKQILHLIKSLFILFLTGAYTAYAGDSIPDVSRLAETTDILGSMGIDPYTKPERLRSTTKVGTPATSFDVSPTGGAVWQMAFDAPPGTGGMTPQIGLVYNSQSGMGIAGWGMSVSGLSVITRGGKDIYHDGDTRGIAYDGHDALYLDGVRLLLASGTEGATNAVYHPEGDPFTDVTVKNGSSATGPVWFEVNTPDGRTLRYGYTTSSRLQVTVSGTTRNAAWHISRRQDPNGNYIEYAYDTDHYTVYPTTVTYGMNTNTALETANTVAFTYNTLPESQRRHFSIGGKTGYVGRKLECVTARRGSTVYRQYVLTYDDTLDGTAKKYPRLAIVTAKNGQGDAMNPVTLEWNALPGAGKTMAEMTTGLDYISHWVEFRDSVMAAADMDGDGISDIIRFSNVYAFNNGQPYPQSKVYIRLSSEFLSGTTICREIYLPYAFAVNGFDRIYGATHTGDFDGDGREDIMIPAYINVDGVKECYMEYILGRNISSADTINCPMRNTGSDLFFAISDVNGDGMADGIAIENKLKENKYGLHFVFFRNNGSKGHVSVSISLPSSPKRLYTADCDDDGLPDLIVLHDSGYTIFRNNGGTDFAGIFTDQNIFTGTSIQQRWVVEQGDFNGDGRLDFIWVGNQNGRYHFALNNGNGTFNVFQALESDLHDQSTDKDDQQNIVIPIDLDHDGFTDLVIAKSVYSGNTFQRTGISWLTSDGTSLTEVRRVYSPTGRDTHPWNFTTGDFDGDGRVDLMNMGVDLYTSTNASSDPVRLRYYKTNGITAGSGLLSSITDGMGQTTQVTYSTLSDTIYTHQYASSYPMADVHAPLTVVRSAYQPANGTMQTVNYAYEGLKVVLGGKGLLGFSSTSAYNISTGILTESGISSWDTSRYVPLATWERTTADGVAAQIATTQQIYTFYGNNYATLPSYITETDYDGHITTTFKSWDAEKGKPLTERTVYDNDDDMYNETTCQNYVKKGGRWLPQTVVSSRRHSDDDADYTKTATYAYDLNGNVIQQTSLFGTPLELTTTYTYDQFGNVTSRHTSGGVANVTEYTEYDPSGRFPVRKWQSPAGVENTYTYDTWGNVLTATDATEAGNPLTTSYTRDGWGDVTAETDPTGVTTTYTWGWGTSMGEKFYKETTRDGSGTVTTWYDSSGREKIKIEPGTGGVVHDARLAYDRFGEVLLNLRTTTGGQTVSTAVEQTFRDSRGRVSRKWYNTGAFTNYVYGDRCVTATDQNGRVTETEFDAWGNIVSTTDDAGNTVSYLYCSNGKPSAVTVEAADGSSSTVTMEYDDAGNRTLLNDPDAGEVTCEWSADDKLLSYTDARGYETVNTYDTQGRLISSVTDSIATTYTYGTSGHGTQRLTSESRGGFTLSYTYDQYGRTSSESRHFGGGTTLTHTYIYDSYGRLQEKDYPSGLEAYYYYDDNGFLNGMQTNHHGDAWNLLSYDGLTMRTETGTDGLYATTVNDTWGKLTERYVTFGNSTDKLCRLAFTYDNETGNLTSRTGVDLAGRTHQFSYDTLDRLTASGSQTYTYSDNGNILSKTDIGSYTYSAAKPHAVTYVDNISGDIKTHNAEYDAFGKVSCVRGRGTGGPNILFGTGGGAVSQPAVIPPIHAVVIGWGDSYRVNYGPDGERWRSSYRDTTVVAVESTTHVNVRSGREILYAGDYERVTDKSGTVREFHYLGQGVIAVITDGGEAELYHAVTDNIGSYVHLVNAVTGNADFSASYDAWGRMTTAVNTLPFHRGYGGHEMLTEFGLVNMNGRMYDYNLGRFLSPDNYVQMPHDSQSFNRYSYCLNNPLKYTDPSGEVWLVPILAGALIGGAISGASYAVSVALTASKWNGGDFLKSIGMGAFAGALSAGMGQASVALGISKVTANTVGYKMFSQITNSIATNAVFGNNMDWSDVAGIAVSSFVATKLPYYKATGKGLFSNFIGETIHNTLAGATSGFVQGATKSLVKNDARYVLENTVGGALSGFSRTVALNALLGSPYKTHPAYDKSSGIIRKGGVFGLYANSIKNGENMGITIGRNSYSVDGNLYTSAHESYHLSDIERMGWAVFYSRIIYEYLRYGFHGSYKTEGTLEDFAVKYERIAPLLIMLENQ